MILLLILIATLMLMVILMRRKQTMIRVYGEDKEKSVQKCVNWMSTHHLSFERVTKKNVNKEIVIDILKLTEGGFDDCVKNGYHAALNNCSFTEALNFIVKNPAILKEPILFSETKLVVGFQIEDLSVFLPRNQRGIGS